MTFFSSTEGTYMEDVAGDRHVLRYPIIPNAVTDWGLCYNSVQIVNLLRTGDADKFECTVGFSKGDNSTITNQEIMMTKVYSYWGEEESNLKLIAIINSDTYSPGDPEEGEEPEEMVVNPPAAHWFYTFDTVDSSGNLEGLLKLPAMETLPGKFYEGKRVFLKETETAEIGNKLRLDHCWGMYVTWKTLVAVGLDQVILEPIDVVQRVFLNATSNYGTLTFTPMTNVSNSPLWCNLTGLDVVSHEMGHTLNNYVNAADGTVWIDDIQEFFADLLAMVVYTSTLGLDINDYHFIRDLDTDTTFYTPDLDQVHNSGRRLGVIFHDVIRHCQAESVDTVELVTLLTTCFPYSDYESETNHAFEVLEAVLAKASTDETFTKYLPYLLLEKARHLWPETPSAALPQILSGGDEFLSIGVGPGEIKAYPVVNTDPEKAITVISTSSDVQLWRTASKERMQFQSGTTMVGFDSLMVVNTGTTTASVTLLNSAWKDHVYDFEVTAVSGNVVTADQTTPPHVDFSIDFHIQAVSTELCMTRCAMKLLTQDESDGPSYEYNGETWFELESVDTKTAARDTGLIGHPYADIKKRDYSNGLYLSSSGNISSNFGALRVSEGSSIDLRLDVGNLNPGVYVYIIDSLYRNRETNENNNVLFVEIQGQPTLALDYNGDDAVDLKDSVLWLTNDDSSKGEYILETLTGSAPDPPDQAVARKSARSVPIYHSICNCQNC